MMQQPYLQTELSSGVYTATLLDHAGDPVLALDSLEVWLRDVKSKAYLNGRHGQSVLNAHGGTFVAGLFTWMMEPEDHAIIRPARSLERHEAIFHATWDSGAKSKTWSVQWVVTNYKPLPSVGLSTASGTSTASATSE